MEHFNVATIGPGPAESTLARKLAGKMQVIALDKRYQCGTEGFDKPYDDLLTSDAQRSFIRDGLTPPVDVIVNPQIFSARTIDVVALPTCNYQRDYININRRAFDLWMRSLIPASVEVYRNSPCREIQREDDKQHIIFHADGQEQHITACCLAGVDGANSMVWRHLYPDHRTRKYVAIQQQFAKKHSVPFYSYIFDNSIANCYSWNTSKDGYSIFSGAYPMKDSQTRFTTLKEKMSVFQFRFGKAVKSEKCTVLLPSRWQDFVCGKDNAFLVGEVVGFTSASSLKGISYTLGSADIPCPVLLKQPEKLNTAYWCATRKLCLKLFGKIVKS